MLIYSFRTESEGRVNRPWRDLPGDGTVLCFIPDPDMHHLLVDDQSLFAALGTDRKVTIELRDHAPGESPCVTESPESWAFSGAAVRLMR